MDQFKVIIVEDVLLELKGTLGILKSDIPEAEVIGTAENEPAYWKLLTETQPCVARFGAERFYHRWCGDMSQHQGDVS